MITAFALFCTLLRLSEDNKSPIITFFNSSLSGRSNLNRMMEMQTHVDRSRVYSNGQQVNKSSLIIMVICRVVIVKYAEGTFRSVRNENRPSSIKYPQSSVKGLQRGINMLQTARWLSLFVYVEYQLNILVITRGSFLSSLIFVLN